CMALGTSKIITLFTRFQLLLITAFYGPLSLLLFFLFFVNHSIYTQSSPENYYTNQTRFERISIKDGLPSNTGNAFLQDREGYLWIGTFNGLAKYDGYTFKSYQKERTNPDNSLAGNFIRALYQDKDGHIWIGTMLNGLQRFDPITENFTTYPHSLPDEMDRFITTITGDSLGNIWVGTANGLWQLSSKDGSFQPETTEKVFFTPKPYPDTLLKFCANAVESSKLIVGFQRVGKNQRLKKSFSLTQQTPITIVGQGEYGGNRGMVDYGWISNDEGAVVWKMELPDTYVAPSSIDRNEHAANRLVIQNIALPSGKYTLHYRTDDRHHFNDWNLAFLPQPTNDDLGAVPAFPNLWGIQLLEFTETELAWLATQLATVERSKTIAGSYVTSLYLDSLQQLWIGTTGGANKLTLEQGEPTISYLNNQFEADGTSNLDFVGTIYPNRKGGIWIAGQQFNYEENTYHFSIESLKNLSTNELTPFFQSTEIRHKTDIIEDSNQNIWLAAYRQGLYQLQATGNNYQLVLYPFATPHASNFFKDQSEVIWIGVWQEGVYKMTPSSGQFRFMSLPTKEGGLVNALAKDERGQVFVGTSKNWLYEWYRTQNKLNPLPLPSNLPKAPLVRHLLVSRQNQLWIGTEGKGIFVYDLNKRQFVPPPIGDNWLAMIPSKNITGGILQDQTGNIWIGGNQGITQFNPNTQKATHHNLIEGRTDVNKMLLDSVGNLWWADGFQGLFKLPSLTLQNFTATASIQSLFPNKTFDGLTEATSGRLWLATRTGLELFDPRTEQFIPFKNQYITDGLLISYLLPNASSQLWLSTPKGIGRYNIETGAFNLFGAESGIFLDEYDGGNSLLIESGEIVVGGKNGFYYFHPSEVRPNPSLPKVDIKRLTVQEEKKDAANTIVSTNLDLQTNTVTLSPRQNSFEIEYVGLHFDKSASNQYAYRLLGLSDRWIQVGREKATRFYSLPAGEYTFEVKASNGDGIWNDQPTALSITVLPHWWRSP
ncbi:MAG: two-component regulator propeller domain-containing protein, partial [Bacteroidota bacterium]